VTPELTRALLQRVACDATGRGGGGDGGGGGGVPPATPPAVAKLRGAVQGVRARSKAAGGGGGGALSRELRGELVAGVRKLFASR
jgi:hypothetical protein